MNEKLTTLVWNNREYAQIVVASFGKRPPINMLRLVISAGLYFQQRIIDLIEILSISSNDMHVIGLAKSVGMGKGVEMPSLLSNPLFSPTPISYLPLFVPMTPFFSLCLPQMTSLIFTGFLKGFIQKYTHVLKKIVYFKNEYFGK